MNGETPNEGRNVMVRNRDIPLLADIVRIMREIVCIEERREWQRERMLHITRHLTGMPPAKGMAKGFEDVMAMLSELDGEHEAKCREYVRMMKRAQRILNGIDSGTMRTFVLLRYVMDAADVDIQREMNMTRRGFERARRAVEDAQEMAAVKWTERYFVQNAGKL